jgi:hypothetical protein
MHQRKGIGTTIIVVIVVIVLVTGTIGLAMFASQEGKFTSQSTTSTTSPTSSIARQATNSTTSAQGLQLTESVNASTITVGQSLNVSLSILNTLPSVSNVLPSSDWRFQGVPVDLWPTCYFGLPAEAVVLDGNYSLQELPSVANVTFSYICMEDVSVNHVIFQPSSDQVNINGVYSEGGNETLGPFQLALNFTDAGYWNLTSLAAEVNTPIIGQSQTPPPAYTTFSPGVYTVAVDDEWGQAVVVHVTVLPASTTSSASYSSTTSGLTSTTSVSPQVSSGAARIVFGNPVSHPVTGKWGGATVSFVLYQVIPITVYAATPTPMNLTVSNPLSSTWAHLANASVIASPTGGNTTLTIMGAVVESQGAGLSVEASSPGLTLNSTVDIESNGVGNSAIVLHAPSDQLLPSAMGGSDQGMATYELSMVYDPANVTTDPAALNVSLDVLGILVNGSIQSSPNMLSVGFTNTTFTLAPYQPTFVTIFHETESFSPTSYNNYTLAVAETVNGATSTQYIAMDFSPASSA